LSNDSYSTEKDLGLGQEQLKKLENELEQGELHNALETRTSLQQLLKKQNRNKQWQSISHRMSALQPRLRELRDWQHWSNNKVRKRLIAEMEVLPAADLHPRCLAGPDKRFAVGVEGAGEKRANPW